MEGPQPVMPPEEIGPPGRGLGFRGRGMGGGRGMGMGPPSAGERPLPGPWCPWWRYQEPEVED